MKSAIYYLFTAVMLVSCMQDVDGDLETQRADNDLDELSENQSSHKRKKNKSAKKKDKNGQSEENEGDMEQEELAEDTLIIIRPNRVDVASNTIDAAFYTSESMSEEALLDTLRTIILEEYKNADHYYEDEFQNAQGVEGRSRNKPEQMQAVVEVVGLNNVKLPLKEVYFMVGMNEIDQFYCHRKTPPQ